MSKVHGDKNDRNVGKCTSHLLLSYHSFPSVHLHFSSLLSFNSSLSDKIWVNGFTVVGPETSMILLLEKAVKEQRFVSLKSFQLINWIYLYCIVMQPLMLRLIHFTIVLIHDLLTEISTEQQQKVRVINKM